MADLIQFYSENVIKVWFYERNFTNLLKIATVTQLMNFTHLGSNEKEMSIGYHNACVHYPKEHLSFFSFELIVIKT